MPDAAPALGQRNSNKHEKKDLLGEGGLGVRLEKLSHFTGCGYKLSIAGNVPTAVADNHLIRALINASKTDEN